MKLILKLLLSLALLGVVFGVSYLKTRPESESGGAEDISLPAEPVVTGKSAPTGAIPDNPAPETTVNESGKAVTKVTVDSPPAEAAAQVSKDSPKILALSAGQTSAPGSTEKQDSHPAPVVEKDDTLPADSPESENKTDSDKQTRAEQILLYFQRKLNALPDDLSSYEKKVAIKEVRDETCELFHISRVKLNQLARRRKIKYP